MSTVEKAAAPLVPKTKEGLLQLQLQLKPSPPKPEDQEPHRRERASYSSREGKGTGVAGRRCAMKGSVRQWPEKWDRVGTVSRCSAPAPAAGLPSRAAGRVESHARPSFLLGHCS